MKYLDEFLATDPSIPLSETEAAALARHLAECDTCAEAIASKDLHREALLDALRTKSAPPPSPAHMAQATRAEFRAWARAVLSRIGDDARDRLEKMELPIEADSPEFQPLRRELSDRELLAVLAVVEARLAIQSLALRSSDDKVVLHADGSLHTHERSIPRDYLAARIAERTGMSHDLAYDVWRAVTSLVFDGTVGMPYITEGEKSADTVALRVNLDTRAAVM